MEWSVGHSTPAGKRGKTEIPQRSEEAQVPPRGKRVAVAQWNERVQTNQKDWNSYCSSLRSNHFVMSQTLFVTTTPKTPSDYQKDHVHKCD
ncbi:hypothetical protein P8864_21335 [Priestia flexa]|uniref:hypothetical protein n=1 Tax=Priestia flexa TaxID=86664 RepID=UPI000CBBA195|nr:hypothetical protein [Priestia flexa]MEC0668391.1 hypothetical protein [Priestia flexa]